MASCDPCSPLCSAKLQQPTDWCRHPHRCLFNGEHVCAWLVGLVAEPPTNRLLLPAHCQITVTWGEITIIAETCPIKLACGGTFRTASPQWVSVTEAADILIIHSPSTQPFHESSGHHPVPFG